MREALNRTIRHTVLRKKTEVIKVYLKALVGVVEEIEKAEISKKEEFAEALASLENTLEAELMCFMKE